MRCLLPFMLFLILILLFSTQFIIFEPYSQCHLTWERKIESGLHLPALLFILQKHNGVNHIHVLCYKNYSPWDESHAVLYSSQNFRAGRYLKPQSTCLLSKPLAMMADTSVSPPPVPCVSVCWGLGAGVVTNPWVANTDWWNSPPHSELQFDFSQIALWETGEKIVLLF